MRIWDLKNTKNQPTNQPTKNLAPQQQSIFSKSFQFFTDKVKQNKQP